MVIFAVDYVVQVVRNKRLFISLLPATRSFRIRHRPSHPLQIRIGLHSGSVVSGVVGTKVPKYTLYGEGMNEAAK